MALMGKIGMTKWIVRVAEPVAVLLAESVRRPGRAESF